MKKLSLVLMLFSLPAYSQTSIATIKSTPIYSHGVLLPLVIDAPHGINVICRIRGSIRKRYLQVFVGVHNTYASGNLDFEPSGITLIRPYSTPLHPMTAEAVREMAKGTARRQMFGVMGATLLLDFSNSVANANNQNMQVYEQMRTDDMSDAAFAKIGDDFLSIQDHNLLHETIFPGQKQWGFVYFDLGKDGAANNTFGDYVLTAPIGGQIYEMDFASSASASLSTSANVAPVAAQITPPLPAALPQSPHVAARATAPDQQKNSVLQISSTPIGADIELDGNFVGNAPSQIDVPPGNHSLRLTMNGYLPWEKKLQLVGASASIDAQMQQKMVYTVR